ncbi:MAG: aspartate carbamoyltransferase catalytic subunit [Firmicutes bacterium]|nr:aspartate carbamoyltransferase catalytic subunit [Bacillota bacterium]MCL2256284.1 aspartate carbamoyltransferase catalytic subunit [Bacillota bacterium]
MKRKDLLYIKDLSKDEILEILEEAKEMRKLLDKGERKLNVLSGLNVTTLFYENSTRTRVSFENAAKILGASTSSISVATSAVQKGETLIDTGKNLDALLCDFIIMRHSQSGAPSHLAKNVNAKVVNAGDGMNEHPTQALLDAYTMRERFQDFKGLNITIVGDIKHSRVARSNIYLLSKLGARVTLCAPKTLLPIDIEKTGAKYDNCIDSATKGADVVMALRMQLERQKAALFPSQREYHAFYGVKAGHIGKNTMLMHPGPCNRGLDIASSAYEHENSVILPQVTNGVAVRMAILKLLKEGND